MQIGSIDKKPEGNKDTNVRGKKQPEGNKDNKIKREATDAQLI